MIEFTKEELAAIEFVLTNALLDGETDPSYESAIKKVERALDGN